MFLANYLDLLEHNLQQLESILAQIGSAHAKEPEILQGSLLFAKMMSAHLESLRPHLDHYWRLANDAPDGFKLELFHGPRKGSAGLLRDLQDLYVQAAMADSTVRTLSIGARALRDHALEQTVKAAETDISRLNVWLHTHLKARAAQTLVVASS